MTEPVMKPGSIVPKGAAPLRTLTAVMAIMCYLAVLAVGSLLIINRSVQNWSKGLASEVTVQIKEISTRSIEDDLKKVAALMEQTKGVSSVDILSRADAEKLLEPWLGSQGLDKLPVPRLIRVTVDPAHPPDFAKLSEDLKQAVPPARLDTHQRWEQELRRMAGTLSLLSGLVLVLVSASAVAMVIFASRAVLEANRQIVDILHLAGAEDGFIAGALDWQFVVTGLWAGTLGLAAGLLTFLALGFSGSVDANGVAAAARGLFYIPEETDKWKLLFFLLVPAAATAIALLTSRLTLMRMLREVR